MCWQGNPYLTLKIHQLTQQRKCRPRPVTLVLFQEHENAVKSARGEKKQYAAELQTTMEAAAAQEKQLQRLQRECDELRKAEGQHQEAHAALVQSLAQQQARVDELTAREAELVQVLDEKKAELEALASRTQRSETQRLAASRAPSSLYVSDGRSKPGIDREIEEIESQARQSVARTRGSRPSEGHLPTTQVTTQGQSEAKDAQIEAPP